MDIKTLVQLHMVLGNLQQCCQSGGLPQTISVESLKAITEVEDIIEKLVAYMKIQAIPYFNLINENTTPRS